MNIYSKKQIWKLSLLFGALFIALASLFYTNSIVAKLAEEEEKKVELVAEATRRLASLDGNQGDIGFLFKIIKDNETVPVICVDEQENIMSWRNLDSADVADNPEFLKERFAEMKGVNAPIAIPVADGEQQYIYFENSILIDLLSYYPYMQLSIIGLFIIISYLAFSSSRNAEQNQVWVGMAKETAHQLGTPLSSLIGWVEYLKSIGTDDSIVDELRKDVNRLETITDRFSKIGSKPTFDQVKVVEALHHVIGYLKSRISNQVDITIEGEEQITADICIPLFEWVIENITKNAVDAMDGKGTIHFFVSRENKLTIIEILDSGKGIPKGLFTKIFLPGFTTKKRGWGLGLSLAKRIIEDYHSGAIFIKNSEIGEGTKFRIEL